MDIGLDTADRPRQDVGDFRIAQAFDMAKRDGKPVTLGQLPE
jgi:hypothetical protein